MQQVDTVVVEGKRFKGIGAFVIDFSYDFSGLRHMDVVEENVHVMNWVPEMIQNIRNQIVVLKINVILFLLNHFWAVFDEGTAQCERGFGISLWKYSIDFVHAFATWSGRYQQIEQV